MKDFCKLCKILFLLSLFSLSSCITNQPMTLNAVEAPDYSQRILSHSLYAKVDKFSFTTAITKYPANDGYHKIPVGEYFLIGVLDEFIGTNASKIKLSEFVSQCESVGFLLPKATCKTKFSLSFEMGEHQREISGDIESSVGSLLVRDQDFLGLMYQQNDGPIVEQVKSAINDVLEHIRIKIKE